MSDKQWSAMRDCQRYLDTLYNQGDVRGDHSHMVLLAIGKRHGMDVIDGILDAHFKRFPDGKQLLGMSRESLRLPEPRVWNWEDM